MFDLSQWINPEFLSQLFEFVTSGLVLGIFFGSVALLLGLIIYSGIMCFR